MSTQELELRLQDLTEELQLANQSMQTLLNMGTEVDLSFQIEMITENINAITKEMASIIDAMN